METDHVPSCILAWVRNVYWVYNVFTVLSDFDLEYTYFGLRVHLLWAYYQVKGLFVLNDFDILAM